MGNSFIQFDNEPEPTQRDPKDKAEQQYSYISQRMPGIVGMPRLVKSNLTGIELEEYFVTNPESRIQADSNIYKLRSSSYSKNIAVVFNHKLIDESEKLFMVRIQKMKGRLNEIEGLTTLEGLVLLEAALNGFAELIFHAKTPFVITQKMISINESSYVRVWLNENYALNKITSDIKIRSENMMIHQLFSAIADHVAIQQRQGFSDIRFKIIHSQRLFEAKNIIMLLLQGANRKLTLQQLVDKQISKIVKNSGKVETNPIPVQTIKIPMNLPALTIEAGPQRFQLKAEDVITNDEGMDRIRMVRQANTHTSMSSNPTHPLPVFVKGTFEQLDKKLNTGHASSQREQNQAAYILPEDSHPQRNALRTTSIFGPIIKQNVDFVNIGSPNKSKPSMQELVLNRNKPNPDILNNKIKQIQRRIDNLKQELNHKNSHRKFTIPFTGLAADQRTERHAVTPPHFSKSNLSEENRPVSRYQPNMKVKTETTVGENSNKINIKLNGVLGRNYLGNTQQEEKTDKNDQPQRVRGPGEIKIKQQFSIKKPTVAQPTSPFLGNEQGLKGGQKLGIAKGRKSPSPGLGNKNRAVGGQEKYRQRYQINYNSPVVGGVPPVKIQGVLMENKSTITIRNNHF